MIISTKKCAKCKEEKSLDSFSKDSKAKSGYRTYCKICSSIYFASYYKKNQEKLRVEKIAYYYANRNHIIQHHIKYLNSRRQTDPYFCMVSRLRSRLGSVFRNKKPETTMKLLGCTKEELCQYIESKFLPGMTWENRNKWHIDHIRPFASFDLTDPEQVKQACHYTNLQPLWAKDNLSKNDKWEND